VKDRIDGKRATIAQGRRIVRHAVHILDELGDQALAWISDPSTDAAAAGTTLIPMRTRPAPATLLSTPTRPAARATSGRACKD
jgi:hypothetical protein